MTKVEIFMAIVSCVLAFVVGALLASGCATTQVEVVTTTPEGGTETVSLGAKTFFADIKEATQSAAIQVEETGAYSVDTGQQSKGLDSTALAEAVVATVDKGISAVTSMSPATVAAFRGPAKPANPTPMPPTDARLDKLEEMFGQLIRNLGMEAPTN